MEIKLDLSRISGYFHDKDYNKLLESGIIHTNELISKKCKGNDFLGWIDLPAEIDEDLIKDIENTSKQLAETSDIIVVIGIGGSYLGARAVIESQIHSFNFLDKKNKHPHIVYAGQTLSQNYYNDLLDILNDYNYSIIVISKSGTTTEPALAFRLLKQHIEAKYGKEKAKERIAAITDKNKGALRKLADAEGYKTFVIPDDVGGRFSVLTPVGLLPIATAGCDIRKLVEGAKYCREYILDNKESNIALEYAAARNALYKSGKEIEIQANYNPALHYFTEWWKQLYGESEGKDGKGIFPASVDFTTDLHSMGQLIQDGKRNIFESVIWINKYKKSLVIPEDNKDLDGLNFIQGKELNYVNSMAMLGTAEAHSEGKVPIIKIIVPDITEFEIGELIYFYEFACGISGLILGVNPFDQPGVEAYKKNMFKLLGKPGY